MASTELLIQTAVNGILLGGIYATAALGLSLIFGIMDVVNVAHGHFLMLGGYVAVILFATAGLTPIVGMLVAFALLFAAGYAAQEGILKYVMEKEAEQPLLLLFGAALVMQNLVRYFLGSTTQASSIGIPRIDIALGPILFPFTRTVTFVLGVTLIGATWAFLRFTRVGSAIRATAQNPAAARYVGVETSRIYALTFGLGAGLAGASGALLSMTFPVTPFVGWSYLLKTFAVVILAGLGSIGGVLVAGVSLGVIENVGTLFVGGGNRNVVTFGIFLLVLILMPQGLFGTREGEP